MEADVLATKVPNDLPGRITLPGPGISGTDLNLAEGGDGELPMGALDGDKVNGIAEVIRVSIHDSRGRFTGQAKIGTLLKGKLARL